VDVLYDIACQYHKNFMTRLKHLPADVQNVVSNFTLRWFIDKFHLEAHGPDCHCKFSLYTAKGVGQTHGSSMEQEWAHSKGLAVATREMGPGARHMALDVHWSSWNWNLLLRMGK
jgi:hypothetical protein